MAISADPAPFTHGSKHMLMLSWSHTHKKFNLSLQWRNPRLSETQAKCVKGERGGRNRIFNELGFQRNVRPPIVLEKGSCHTSVMVPVRVPLYKNWSEDLCNYLFQQREEGGFRMRNKRWDPRYKSIIISYWSELEEMFDTASNMKNLSH